MNVEMSFATAMLPLDLRVKALAELANGLSERPAPPVSEAVDAILSPSIEALKRDAVSQASAIAFKQAIIAAFDAGMARGTASAYKTVSEMIGDAATLEGHRGEDRNTLRPTSSEFDAG